MDTMPHISSEFVGIFPSFSRGHFKELVLTKLKDKLSDQVKYLEFLSLLLPFMGQEERKAPATIVPSTSHEPF